MQLFKNSKYVLIGWFMNGLMNRSSEFIGGEDHVRKIPVCAKSPSKTLTIINVRMLIGEIVNIMMLLFVKQEIAGRNFILLDDFGALLIRFGNVVVEMMIVEDAEAEN